jgi:DNA-binding ferritin-like protein
MSQEIVRYFLKSQAQLKLLHWQTKSYAKHKAFEDTYNALEDMIDEFIEAFQGKYGRIFLEDKTLELININDDKINSLAQDNIQFLEIQLTSLLNEHDVDLLSIKDDMIIQWNKLRYLLTLD